MDREIMKGSIDILILSLIQKNETYGYEIASYIKKNSQGIYIMGEGTLYPALKRLENKSLIESYWKLSEEDVRRKYYRITLEGKKALKDKLNQWKQVNHLITIFQEE